MRALEPARQVARLDTLYADGAVEAVAAVARRGEGRVEAGLALGDGRARDGAAPPREEERDAVVDKAVLGGAVVDCREARQGCGDEEGEEGYVEEGGEGEESGGE